jgi:hypothetical protein
LCSSRGTEQLKLREFAEQPVDDIKVGGGAVGTGQAAHHRQSANHY